MSFIHTEYSHLSDDELIRQAELSTDPMTQELTERLLNAQTAIESSLKTLKKVEQVNDRVIDCICRLEDEFDFTKPKAEADSQEAA